MNGGKKLDNQEILLKIIVESWRFMKTTENLINRLPAVDQLRYINRCQWYSKMLIENTALLGAKILVFDGQEYDNGMPVTALNLEEFGPDDTLVIEQTLEPTILDVTNNQLLKMGTVMLRKAV